MINMKKITNLFIYLFIILVFAIIVSYFLTKYYSNKIFTPLYSYAESESKKIVTEIINSSLTEELETSLDSETIYEIIKNEDDEIQLIDFNTSKVNKILTNLSNNIENRIKNIEEEQLFKENEIITTKDGLIYNIPIGAVTGNVFLTNIGTKIPLKITIMGDVLSTMETEVTEYGLNNALLKIGIKVTINTRVIAPFTSKKFTIEHTIPISIKVIQGKIPEYYLNGNYSNQSEN